MIRLEQTLFGATFRNPVLLAAGTCGFGREVHGVTDLEALGGLVTKSVTREERRGNPAPRVTEFGAGMLNSIGLTNPGVEAVLETKLPWLDEHLRRSHAFVSVAGHTPGEFVSIVETLDDAAGFLGYEINLSCPNDTRREERAFALDPDAVFEVVEGVRIRTDRPILAKLAPNDPDRARTVRSAEDAGADGITLVNTMPGLALDPETGRPRLGAGSGGVSGPALRPVGVEAVREARGVTDLPLVGAGGITRASDAIQYLRAGASLVQVGTASLADPRAAERIADGLRTWGGRDRTIPLRELIGGGRTTDRRGRPERGAVAATPGGA